MNTDLIMSWPRNCDYPLFRGFLKLNRYRFENVFIVFTETHQGDDYRDFVRNAINSEKQFGDAEVVFLQSPVITDGQDWRDVAVNEALRLSHSEWVWFTEQDFFPNEGFWEEVEKTAIDNDVIGVQEGVRLHPCSLFMKREVLEKTSKFFGIKPDVADHFYKIARDITRLAESDAIKVSILDPHLYHHMAGLSHNMRLLCDEGLPNHDIDGFRDYVKKCMEIPLPIPVKYREVFEKYLQIEG